LVGDLGKAGGGDALAMPDGGHAEQLRVETGPAMITQIEDQPSRRQIICGPILAEVPRVQNGGEKRKIRFNKIRPSRLRGFFLKFNLSRLQGKRWDEQKSGTQKVR